MFSANRSNTQKGVAYTTFTLFYLLLAYYYGPNPLESLTKARNNYGDLSIGVCEEAASFRKAAIDLILWVIVLGSCAYTSKKAYENFTLFNAKPKNENSSDTKPAVKVCQI
jgi:hypothetical protein